MSYFIEIWDGAHVIPAEVAGIIVCDCNTVGGTKKEVVVLLRNGTAMVSKPDLRKETEEKARYIRSLIEREMGASIPGVGNIPRTW